MLEAESCTIELFIRIIKNRDGVSEFKFLFFGATNECGIINTQISQDRAIISLLTPCQRVRSRSFRSGRYFSAYFAIRESSSFNTRLLLPLVGEPHRHKEQEEGRESRQSISRAFSREPFNRAVVARGNMPPVEFSHEEDGHDSVCSHALLEIT